MKLTQELIDDYLDGSLGHDQADQLKLWLKSHPADAAKVERQRALSAALVASAPALSAARSKEMWANIKNRVAAEQAQAPVIVLGSNEPWYAFLFRPWAGAGLVTAGLALAVLVWRPWTVAPPAPPDPLSVAATEAPAAAVAPMASTAAPVEAKSVEMARAKRSMANVAAPEADVAAAASSAAPMSVRSEEATVARAAEPTEVERALADSGVDGMIDAYLAAQRSQRRAPAVAGLSRGGARSPLAGFSAGAAPMVADDALDSVTLSTAQGGQDSNGFWNWSPAATALNRHDWTQVRLELNAARGKAAEASERAFAASALTLLSAPGAPLAGQGETLPNLGELRVLGAGRWQLLVDSRLARFSEGVSTRLPGFRAEGDSLLLDLTFDRGTFAPGTRFTRVAGEAPAEVINAQGQTVAGDEFSAPTGATYNVSGRQLKLR